MQHAAQHMPCLCMHVLLRLCVHKALVTSFLHLFVGKPIDLTASLHHRHCCMLFVLKNFHHPACEPNCLMCIFHPIIITG